MKRSIRTIISILVLIVLAVSSANLFSYAYFYSNSITADNNLSGNLGDKNIDPTVIKVTTIEEFIKSVTASTYNDSASHAGARQTIMLTKNLTIARTVKVTADVNIDLNGRTITLSNADLIFDHNYSGVTDIYGGDIAVEGAGGKIMVKLPRGRLEYDTVSLNGVAVEQIEYSQSMVIDGAFGMVSAALDSNTSSRGYYNGTQPRNRYCTRHGGVAAAGGCSYVCRDIDLPMGYYGYNVNIKYTSSHPLLISNMGRLDASAVGGVQDVTLTVQISIGSEKVAKTFNIHPYDSGDTAAAESVALVEAGEYFEKFYSAEHGVYKIGSTVQLMNKSEGGKALYQYVSYSKAAAIMDSSTELKGVHFKVDSQSEGYGYVVSPDENLHTLRVYAGGTKFIALQVDGNDVSSVKDNYTIALEVAEAMYTKSFTVKVDGGKSGFTQHRLYGTLQSYVDEKAITEGNLVNYAAEYGFEFRYQLSYDIDNTYRMGSLGDDKQWLYVFSGKNPPTELQSVGVRMIFTFPTHPTQVSIYMPVKYQPDHESEGGEISKFMPYYNYFDRLFMSASGGYTYNTFTVPFGYGTNGPCYYLEILREDGTAESTIVRQELVYNLGDGDITKTPTAVAAMTGGEIDAVMMTGRAYWRIIFDTTKFTPNNTALAFRYRYKFKSGNMGYEGSWSGLEVPGYISKLTAPGLIKDYATQTNDCMPDAKLYKYIYDNARPNKNAAAYTAGKGMFILTDWLQREFINDKRVSEIDNAGNKIGVGTTHGYRGIEFVKNVKKVNLNKSGINNYNLQYIGQMTGIEVLDLGDNRGSIFDKEPGLLGIPKSGNTYFIRKLYPLVNMQVLHLENNTIYQFGDLKNLVGLKEVCVFGTDINRDLGMHLLFGTDGAVNRATFITMTAKGKIVRNTSHNEGYIDRGGNDNVSRLIDALTSISYPKIIGKNEDIKAAYGHLSTERSDYLNVELSNYFSWKDHMRYLPSPGVSGSATAATATAFTVEYTYYLKSGFLGITQNTVIIELEFDVVRA